MSIVEKIIGIATIGGALSGVGVTRKFIEHIVLLIGLAIMAAIIAGGLAICMLLEIDAALIRHGLDADRAGLVAGFVGLLVLGSVIGTIIYRSRSMGEFPLSFTRPGFAAGAAIHSVVRGFCNGLKQRD